MSAHAITSSPCSTWYDSPSPLDTGPGAPPHTRTSHGMLAPGREHLRGNSYIERFRTVEHQNGDTAQT